MEKGSTKLLNERRGFAINRYGVSKWERLEEAPGATGRCGFESHHAYKYFAILSCIVYLQRFVLWRFFLYLTIAKLNTDMNNKIGVKATGIVAPFIREGDDIVKITVDSVLEAGKSISSEDSHYLEEDVIYYDVHDKDVIGITESVVARSAGLYVSVDDIANDIKAKFGDSATICLTGMIYSRNRFAMILKGIARAAKKLILVMDEMDEVGNPRGVNPFTGVDVEEYYKEICKNENCDVEVLYQLRTDYPSLTHYGVDYLREKIDGFIDCRLHIGNISPLAYESWYRFHPLYTLADICADKNPDFGLLGCNKATEERIKLFPTKKLAAEVCTGVRNAIKEKTGKDVIVMVYGDGHFHSPQILGVIGSSINEFADPTSFLSDEYGNEVLNMTPNEVKLKALIDKSASDAEVRKVLGLNKDRNLKNKMTSMGTTPRLFGWLLASLMDLVSGSGSRCTPFVKVENYFA